jgi:2-hydroxychromene-2-carboxylate isomerase
VIIALAQVSWPSRLGASMRRALGRRGRVELFFAFDDPCSAIALIDLAERLAGRDVKLVLKPVLARGIPGDPAVELKRRYAITDARRLGRRRKLVLTRTEPLMPKDTGFLAGWAASASPGPSLERFCVAALEHLWFVSSGPVVLAAYARLWQEQFGSPPPAAPEDGSIARNERLMKRRGPYDTPAAWVHGEWFFAHDRLAQIGERLDQLGWRAGR